MYPSLNCSAGKNADVSLVPPCVGVFPQDLEILCSSLHWVKQTVFQVNKNRVSMIFYSPTIIQTNPCYKLDLPELELNCLCQSHTSLALAGLLLQAQLVCHSSLGCCCDFRQYLPYLGLLRDDQVFEALLVCVLHTQHGSERQARTPVAPTTSCLLYYSGPGLSCCSVASLLFSALWWLT